MLTSPDITLAFALGNVVANILQKIALLEDELGA